MIKVDNISKAFDSKNVIKNFSYLFESNKNYGLFGDNGCGKSTLLKMLCGLITEDDGEIVFENPSYSCSYVNNNPRSFFMRLSGWENLYYFGGLNNKTIEKTHLFIRDHFKQYEFLSSPVNKLSIGQTQILSILRGFLCEPDFIAFDEVFSTLDKKHEEEIYTCIELYRNHKPNLITVTCAHNIKFLEEICFRIIRL